MAAIGSISSPLASVCVCVARAQSRAASTCFCQNRALSGISGSCHLGCAPSRSPSPPPSSLSLPLPLLPPPSPSLSLSCVSPSPARAHSGGDEVRLSTGGIIRQYLQQVVVAKQRQALIVLVALGQALPAEQPELGVGCGAFCLLQRLPGAQSDSKA